MGYVNFQRKINLKEKIINNTKNGFNQGVTMI